MMQKWKDGALEFEESDFDAGAKRALTVTWTDGDKARRNAVAMPADKWNIVEAEESLQAWLEEMGYRG